MKRKLTPLRVVMLMPFREITGMPGYDDSPSPYPYWVNDQYGLGRIRKQVVLVYRRKIGDRWDYGYTHNFDPDKLKFDKGFLALSGRFRDWLPVEPDSIHY